jgi:hypothetical protein
LSAPTTSQTPDMNKPNLIPLYHPELMITPLAVLMAPRSTWPCTSLGARSASHLQLAKRATRHRTDALIEGPPAKVILANAPYSACLEKPLPRRPFRARKYKIDKPEEVGGFGQQVSAHRHRPSVSLNTSRWSPPLPAIAACRAVAPEHMQGNLRVLEI